LWAIGAVISSARSHAFVAERVPGPCLATVSASPEMISVMVIERSASARIAHVC
jgi:hypothetical protein